jgi:hypothetical protein
MVDFQQFPNQFVELLGLCESTAQSQAAFMCVLELGTANDAIFKIVQQNQFKASDHLKLRFHRGNDESIKKYLATKLKQTLASLSELTERSQFLEQSQSKS